MGSIEGRLRAPLVVRSLAPGIVRGPVAADDPDMAAAGLSRTGDEHGPPKLLEHCAAFERMIGAEGGTARARLESLLGGELAGLLCRALTTAPRPNPQLPF